MAFNVGEFRKHFPILDKPVNKQKLVYFDNAASSLKPKEVAETIYNYYLYETANIHRGAHYLSRQGTEKYEGARGKVAKFIKAQSASEIVFTRGVTEAMNLLSYTLGANLKSGDVILLSDFEHHSNIIPWKLLCERTGARIQTLSFSPTGEISEESVQKAFEQPVKIVSLLLYSNVTGVRLSVEKVVKAARSKGAVSVLDTAQAMLHENIDVQKLDCDFLTFSGHKMLGPYGVGVLYGKKANLDKLIPFQGGGSMISQVNWEKTIYQDAPHKFEAGTPAIPEVLGLGAAIDFIKNYSLSEWTAHGKKLLSRLEEGLSGFKKVKLIGATLADAPKKCDIISFSYEGAHPSDVGEILDQMGVAVRAGHHCAQPLMDTLKIPGTVRASLAPYNTEDEVEFFLQAMRKVETVL